MKIKVEGLELAHSESSDEVAAAITAKHFGVVIEITGKPGGGGWTLVNVIGRPYDIMKMMTEDQGWSTGDSAEDAEMLFHVFREAKTLIG